ncbi:hypothetical protein C8Q76DRAFT_713735 [Earliella scabrosa]|nr:hypothetical protein C8Q76DRAFT_713735 [Earliella scabrosa]
MRLDMVALQYIMDHASIPIPRIHAYDCDVQNVLGHPYMIMDYVDGTPLIEVWNEPSWWTSSRSKEHLLTSLAGHMIELSKLAFDRIGCLDRADDGSYKIVPFISPIGPGDPEASSDPVCGPYDSTLVYLFDMLDQRRAERGPRTFAAYSFLRLLVGGLMDMRYDRAPFPLAHPDLDSQNILVNDAGEVVALLDWDGLRTCPRQLGALAYPAWLTVDWDPLMYGGYKEYDPHCDTEEDLHRYREMYVNAVDTLSDGTLGDVVRNSHVIQSLALAITSTDCLHHILYHVGQYVLGSRSMAYRTMDAIEHGAWFHQGPREIAEVKGERRVFVPQVCADNS